jgi:hypothetical protein
MPKDLVGRTSSRAHTTHRSSIMRRAAGHVALRDHPPYSGADDAPILHPTLRETTDRQRLDAQWAAAVEDGQFDVAVRQCTVITENASGARQTRRLLPLDRAGPPGRIPTRRLHS